MEVSSLSMPRAEAITASAVAIGDEEVAAIYGPA